MTIQLDVLNLPTLNEVFSIEVKNRDNGEKLKEFVPLFMQTYQGGDISINILVDNYLYRIIDVNMNCDREDCYNAPFQLDNDTCRLCLAQCAEEQIKNQL